MKESKIPEELPLVSKIKVIVIFELQWNKYWKKKYASLKQLKHEETENVHRLQSTSKII